MKLIQMILIYNINVFTFSDKTRKDMASRVGINERVSLIYKEKDFLN